jgi:hypothetical protein
VTKAVGEALSGLAFLHKLGLGHGGIKIRWSSFSTVGVVTDISSRYSCGKYMLHRTESCSSIDSRTFSGPQATSDGTDTWKVWRQSRHRNPKLSRLAESCAHIGNFNNDTYQHNWFWPIFHKISTTRDFADPSSTSCTRNFIWGWLGLPCGLMDHWLHCKLVIHYL